MPEITLTANQQAVLKQLVESTEEEQRAVGIYQANLTVGQSRRGVLHGVLKTAFNELGINGVPAAITQLHRELDANGNWTGKVFINQPAP